MPLASAALSLIGLTTVISDVVDFAAAPAVAVPFGQSWPKRAGHYFIPKIIRIRFTDFSTVGGAYGATNPGIRMATAVGAGANVFQQVTINAAILNSIIPLVGGATKNMQISFTGAPRSDELPPELDGTQPDIIVTVSALAVLKGQLIFSGDIVPKVP